MAGKYVLVVDDDLDLVEAIATNLGAKGYEVGKAYDGEEGLASVKERRPDLVVLDVMMPKKDGYQVCDELKKSADYKDIPVILLTAVGSAVSTTSYTHRDGMTNEADEYVAKPVDLDRVAELVAELL
ncbi:MAG: response regulator [Desulfarculaceae bacterium]|nr:response regulator [Desulfarculaceae bacterium]